MSGKPSAPEIAKAKEWFEQTFKSERLPIAFKYAGKESKEILGNWRKDWETAPTEGGTLHTLTMTEPETGLLCRLEITVFDDFPVVEWVGYFKNTGEKDTPIIADIEPLAAIFPAAKGQPCYLHRAKGSDFRIDDFAPRKTKGSSAV